MCHRQGDGAYRSRAVNVLLRVAGTEVRYLGGYKVPEG